MTRVIARAEWGAQYRDGFGNRALSGITKIVLHHSVTTSPPVGSSFSQDCAAIRTLERIGQNRFKGGISYTFAIPKSGRVFAGHSLGRIGAHTGGHNTTAIGVVLVGNYQGEAPTPEQEAALAWLVDVYLPEQGVRVGRITHGHRDFKATSCPGNRAYARIAAINALSGSVTPISRPTPAPPAPKPTGAVLRRGSTGAHVRTLQAHLNRHYPLYSKLAVDGVFGPATERVVREFQRRAFITVDGIAGPVTLGKLGLTLRSSASAPAPKPKPSGAVLRSGSRGSAVRSLQSGLNRGFPAYSKLAVDGIYGPATTRVVREFQSRSGITVDGIVGPQTRRQLSKYGIRVS